MMDGKHRLKENNGIQVRPNKQVINLVKCNINNEIVIFKYTMKNKIYNI